MRSAHRLTSLASLILGLFIGGSVASHAQSTSLTEGLEYIVGFIHPERAAGEPASKNAYRLIISSSTGAKVTIGQLRSETIDAGAVKEIIIDSCDVIRITSDRPISVSSRILMSGNGEQTIHVPTYAWGMKYRPFSWWTDRYGLTSMTYASAKRLVIARDSNTVVRHSRNGILVDTTLNAGEYLYISSAIDTNSYRTSSSDPTGELIEASGPIMVISGHPKVAILEHPDALPASGTYARALNRSRGTLMEAMMPTSYAGTTFVTAPFLYSPTRKRGLDQSDVGVADDLGDVVRMIGLVDETVITRQGATGVVIIDTIDAGQTYTDRRVEHPYVWTTSKPVLCAQYGKSYAHITSQATSPEDDPSTDAGLPMMMNIIGTERWVHRSSVHAPINLANYLTIVTQRQYLQDLLLNDKHIQSIAKIDSVTSDIVTLRLSIPAGSHLIHSENGEARFAVYTYGSNDGLQLCQAYASSTAYDVRIPCTDSIYMNTTYAADTARCVYGVQYAGEATSDSCESMGVAMSYVRDAANCTWTHSNGAFTFIRTNTSDSAYANVIVVSRSGRQLVEHVAIGKTTSITDYGRTAHIVISPQPATDKITLRMPASATHPSTLVLRSMLGDVSTIAIDNEETIDIDVRYLSPGVYMLTTQNYTIPVIIVR